MSRRGALTPYTGVPYGPRRPSKLQVVIGIVLAVIVLAAVGAFVSRAWLSPEYQGVVVLTGSEIVIEYDDGQGLDGCGRAGFEPPAA
jgi:hypothetical protein